MKAALSLIFVLLAGVAFSATNTTDSLVFQDIYASLGGASWTFKPADSTNPCNWGSAKRYVSCSKAGKITKIDLFNNNLVGTIPTTIQNLSSLTKLVLRQNQITGNLPTQLGAMPNLIYLEVHDNSLSGNVPTELLNLTLKTLRLKNNQFAGSLPSFQSSKLQLFEFGGNPKCPLPNYSGYAEETDFTSVNCACNLNPCNHNGVCTGTGPTSVDYTCDCSKTGYYGPTCSLTSPDIASFTSLYYALGGANWQWQPILTDPLCGQSYRISCDTNGRITQLNLNANGLRGSFPDVSSMTSLQVLNLADNDLFGTLPNGLSITSLTKLDISNNHFYGSIPTQFGNLTSLTYLDLSGNSFSSSIPTQFGSLTNLKYLKMAKNNLSGALPTHLGKLTSLKALDLHNNQLTGTVPTEVASLSLFMMDVRYNSLTNQIPNSITSEVVRLSNNDFYGSIPTFSSSRYFLELANNGLCDAGSYSATFYNDVADYSCDPCLSNPCLNKGTCSAVGAVYSCSCPNGFSGTNCQTVDYCGPSPCKNGGTCSSLSNTFSCACTSSWMGATCETPNFCSISPCQNNGTCTNLVDKFLCTCKLGYNGTNCEDQIFCDLAPCQNGGTCINLGTSYTCSCPTGIYGTDCQWFDACDTGVTLCYNNGTCLRSGNSYSCDCPLPYYGSNCSTSGPFSFPAAVLLDSPVVYYNMSFPFPDAPLVGTQPMRGILFPELHYPGNRNRTQDFNNKYLTFTTLGYSGTYFANPFSCTTAMSLELLVRLDWATMLATQSQTLAVIHTSVGDVELRVTWNARLEVYWSGGVISNSRHTTLFQNGVFSHIVMNLTRGSPGSVDLYLDNTKITFPFTFDLTSPTVTIGSNFVGDIDDVAIYCSTLSSGQVATHYGLRN